MVVWESDQFYYGLNYLLEEMINTGIQYNIFTTLHAWTFLLWDMKWLI